MKLRRMLDRKWREASVPDSSRKGWDGYRAEGSDFTEELNWN